MEATQVLIAKANLLLSSLPDADRSNFEVVSYFGKVSGPIEGNLSSQVKCLLTGHEMKPSEVGEFCLNNAKYLKAKANGDFNYSAMTSQLQPHKTKVSIPSHIPYQKNVLFCLLTKRTVNNLKDDVEKHLNGRRFKHKVCKCLLKWVCRPNVAQEDAWKEEEDFV